jgi:hypothetical protein
MLEGRVSKKGLDARDEESLIVGMMHVTWKVFL